MSSRIALVLVGLAAAGLLVVGVRGLMHETGGDPLESPQPAGVAAIPEQGSDCERAAGAIRAGAGAQLALTELGDRIEPRRVTESATRLAVCRAFEGDSSDPCSAGAPVDEDSCTQQFVVTRLVGADAAGEDCQALATAHGPATGFDTGSLTALCRGMAGDAAACDEASQGSPGDSLAAQCRALGANDEAACEACSSERCKRTCTAMLAYHRAIAAGAFSDLGQQGSAGLFTIAQRVALEPGFSCEAWFDAYFLPLCTADLADDTVGATGSAPGGS